MTNHFEPEWKYVSENRLKSLDPSFDWVKDYVSCLQFNDVALAKYLSDSHAKTKLHNLMAEYFMGKRRQRVNRKIR